MIHISILQYILESSFCLASFYILYELVLKKETFFQLNRWYLLLTAAFSLIIPLINVQFTEEIVVRQLSGFAPVVSEANEINAFVFSQLNQTNEVISLSIADVLLFLYSLGAFLLGMRFLHRMFSLFDFIKKRKQTRAKENYILVEAPEGFPASSFFSYIFWNNEESDHSRNLILEHELVHVRQWHSMDVIFMELMVIFHWFNPLVYLFRKSLRALHEYIADHFVVGQFASRYEYARLLAQSHAPCTHQMFNTFSSQAKKRLKMLSKKHSNSIKMIKIFSIIPMTVTLMALFSFNMGEQLPNEMVDPVKSTIHSAENLMSKEISIYGKTYPRENFNTMFDSVGVDRMELTVGDLSFLLFKKGLFSYQFRSIIDKKDFKKNTLKEYVLRKDGQTIQLDSSQLTFTFKRETSYTTNPIDLFNNLDKIKGSNPSTTSIVSSMYHGEVFNYDMRFMKYKIDDNKQWIDDLIAGDYLTIDYTILENGKNETYTAIVNIQDEEGAFAPIVNVELPPTTSELSEWQVVYRDHGKSLIKMDTTNWDNKRRMKAYNGSQNYEIIHIPDFKSRYRIHPDEKLPDGHFVVDIDTNHDLFSIDKDYLPEFVSENDKMVRLAWGKMISMPGIGNFSLKEFNRSSKAPIRLFTGEESQYVKRFDVVLADEHGKVTRIRTENITNNIVQEKLKTVQGPCSIYIDKIVLLHEGELRYYPYTFVFVVE